eukprot:1196233-Prorocentrum_minimum.AAC.13
MVVRGVETQTVVQSASQCGQSERRPPTWHQHMHAVPQTVVQSASQCGQSERCPPTWHQHMHVVPTSLSLRAVLLSSLLV